LCALVLKSTFLFNQTSRMWPQKRKKNTLMHAYITLVKENQKKGWDNRRIKNLIVRNVKWMEYVWKTKGNNTEVMKG
jgi:hypothetical protein